MAEPTTDDPVLARREQIRIASSKAQRAAFLLLGLAMVTFFVGLLTTFSNTIVWAIMVPLVVGCVILAIAIQVGYAIRGAERHDEDSAAQRRMR